MDRTEHPETDHVTDHVPLKDSADPESDEDVVGHMPRIRGGSRGHDGDRPVEGHPPR